MSKKGHRILGLVCVAVALGSGAAVLSTSWADPVLLDGSSGVQLGMSEPQVEAALGRAADRRGRPGPRRYPSSAAAGWFADRGDAHQPVRESMWRTQKGTQKGTLRVQFDGDGAACVVVYTEPRSLVGKVLYYMRSLSDNDEQ